MSQTLRRFDRHYEAIQDQRKLAQILLETGEQAPPTRKGTQLAVDHIGLRGIPAIGRGVTGAIRHTSPHNTR